jgi:UDP-glucuronate decarboxylase
VEFTIRRLAELVIELTGSSSEIVSVPLPPEREGDPAQRCPDISLIRATYGWEPRIDLADGLRRMIEWFRTREGIGGQPG